MHGETVYLGSYATEEEVDLSNPCRCNIACTLQVGLDLPYASLHMFLAGRCFRSQEDLQAFIQT